MRSIELPSIVGFGGFDGAGKDNTAEAIAEFTHAPIIGLGDVMADIVEKLGHDRDDRVIKGEVSRELGVKYNDPAIMANIALGRYDSISVGGMAFDFSGGYANTEGQLYVTSIRRVAEANAIKKRGGAILWVHAPIELRYDRSIRRARGSGDTFDSFDDFIATKEKEMYALTSSEEEKQTNPTIIHSARVFGAADYIYNNPDRTSEELKAHLAATFNLSV